MKGLSQLLFGTTLTWPKKKLGHTSETIGLVMAISGMVLWLRRSRDPDLSPGGFNHSRGLYMYIEGELEAIGATLPYGMSTEGLRVACSNWIHRTISIKELNSQTIVFTEAWTKMTCIKAYTLSIIKTICFTARICRRLKLTDQLHNSHIDMPLSKDFRLSNSQYWQEQNLFVSILQQVHQGKTSSIHSLKQKASFNSRMHYFETTHNHSFRPHNTNGI